MRPQRRNALVLAAALIALPVASDNQDDVG